MARERHRASNASGEPGTVRREEESEQTMAGQKIRIRLKSYDHAGLDSSARKIVDTVTRASSNLIYSYLQTNDL